MKNSQNQNFKFFGQPVPDIRVIEPWPKRSDLRRPDKVQTAVSQVLLHLETKMRYQIKAIWKLYFGKASRNTCQRCDGYFDLTRWRRMVSADGSWCLKFISFSVFYSFLIKSYVYYLNHCYSVIKILSLATYIAVS